MVLDLFLLPFYMINYYINKYCTTQFSYLNWHREIFCETDSFASNSGEKIETLLTVVPQPLNNGNKVSLHLVYLG